MHIVFLSHEYPLWSPGGVGTFLQTLGRALVNEGHRVTVVGPGKEITEEYLEDEGVRLYRLPKKQGLLPTFIHNAIQINKKLKSINQKARIDILESAEGGMAFVSNKHRAKKVIRLHGGHHFFAEAEKRGIDKKKGYLEKRSFKKADGFIAVSNYVKLHTSRYLSFYNKPVEVIPHPMNTNAVLPDAMVKTNRLLFAGTVCEKKGVRELLHAFGIIREKYPNMELDIFGRDWYFPDGRSYIETIQTELSPALFENVVFHGSINRNELFQKYAEAAICIFPSHMETQGLVTLEAMLLEKPVVFSKYGPGPETIDHKMTGLLCDVHDPGDIARNIIWLIENYEEARVMGKHARKEVLAKYRLGTIVQKNLDFYNKLNR